MASIKGSIICKKLYIQKCNCVLKAQIWLIYKNNRKLTRFSANRSYKCGHVCHCVTRGTYWRYLHLFHIFCHCMIGHYFRIDPVYSSYNFFGSGSTGVRSFKFRNWRRHEVLNQGSQFWSNFAFTYVQATCMLNLLLPLQNS